MCLKSRGFYGIPSDISMTSKEDSGNSINKIIENLDPFLVAQMVKNLPPVQETWVPSLGQEDPLEKEMAAHSSIFAWRIP